MVMDQRRDFTWLAQTPRDFLESPRGLAENPLRTQGAQARARGLVFPLPTALIGFHIVNDSVTICCNTSLTIGAVAVAEQGSEDEEAALAGLAVLGAMVSAPAMAAVSVGDTVTCGATVGLECSSDRATVGI